MLEGENIGFLKYPCEVDSHLKILQIDTDNIKNKWFPEKFLLGILREESV